jgi:arylsulfatase A-like enzyme
MKVLVVFIDMIRPNRLSIFNKNIKEETPLDISLRKLGGTYYTNCFTQGLDTPRGMATFATGKIPYKNGCTTRVKWPRYFLNKELKTIYDLFIEKKYKMTLFSNPNERETGMFPEHISNLEIHNNSYDLDKYLSDIELEDNHFVFVALPDFHWSFDDNSYTTHGEQQAYKDAKKSYDIIFKNFDKDDFDHIFIFSDHGFKFTHEFKHQPKYLLLNEDRTNIMMIHRKKGEESISYNDKLCSIADVYPSMESILGESAPQGIPLFAEEQKDYVIAEDHLNFAPSVNQNVEIWAVIKRDLIYVRMLGDAFLLDRKTRGVVEGVDVGYDEILKNESSFIKYIDEYEKVFKYREFIFKQTTYMYGGKRHKISRFMTYLYILKDFIFERVSN